MIDVQPQVFRFLRQALTCVCVAAPFCASALPISCAVDENTDAHQCVAPSEIREIGGIRFAPLYSGGPNKINRTNFTIHANCATRMLHLKDSDGVSFAAGSFSQTDMSRQLGQIICSAALRAPKKK